MKKSLRRLKKDFKMGRLCVDNLRLGLLPTELEIRLAKSFGLIRDKYKAGEILVGISSGDIVELSEPYINNDHTIHYRQAWNCWTGERLYEDDFGGTWRMLPPILGDVKDWSGYYYTYRLATKAEREICQRQRESGITK